MHRNHKDAIKIKKKRPLKISYPQRWIWRLGWVRYPTPEDHKLLKMVTASLCCIWVWLFFSFDKIVEQLILWIRKRRAWARTWSSSRGKIWRNFCVDPLSAAIGIINTFGKFCVMCRFFDLWNRYLKDLQLVFKRSWVRLLICWLQLCVISGQLLWPWELVLAKEKLRKSMQSQW